MGRSKKLLYIIIILLISFSFIGCGSSSIEIQPKNVMVELGNEVSQNILDYVSSTSETTNELKQGAKLDISDVNSMVVGEYQAIVSYKGEEFSIPVEVKDTTPPLISINLTSDYICQDEEGVWGIANELDWMELYGKWR